MKNTSKIIVRASLFVALLLGTYNVRAQFEGIPGFEDTVDDETPVPIDGLVGLAILAGAFYGGKKLRNNNRE